MQPGLYRLVEGSPSRGGFVAFYLSKDWSDLALERGYLKYGFLNLRERPTLKHVAGSQGDRVKINSSGVWVNGSLLNSSAALNADAKGRLMPKFFLQELTLKKGEFLVISHLKTNGLDSRYYGVLNETNLISKAVPIFYF
jgi:conjugative transfer signal peptidase TraF